MQIIKRLLNSLLFRSLFLAYFIIFINFFESFPLFAHKNHKNKIKNKTEKPQILYPTLEKLDFLTPVVGSYHLPIIHKAGNGSLIDKNHKALNLADILVNKITLLSFIYTTCSDQQGCPLATSVLQQISLNIEKNHSKIPKDFQIISLSFDPERDNPKVMHEYGKMFTDKAYWYFLTTKNKQNLKPILKKYNQSILQEFDENGNGIGSISHVLRIFLIDENLNIRNIYSVSFMKPEVILSDIITLIIRKNKDTQVTQQNNYNKIISKHGAGDVKDGYDNKNYKTNSKSLEERKGESLNLSKLFKNKVLGLPDQIHKDSITDAQINLGKKLFFDRRISLNETISCAMCHIPEQGFTSQELATPVGFEGRSLRRNAPTLYNVSYNKLLFHDGREYSLENQVWSPLLKENEMANPSIGYIIKKIENLSDYNNLFEHAFNGEKPNVLNIGYSFAAYLKTFISGNSAFDRWYFGKDENAITDEAKKGFKVFVGKGLCSTCHTIKSNYALFTDHQLHNTGLGYARSLGIKTINNKLQIAPGVFIEIDKNSIKNIPIEKVDDLGHYEITQNPNDRWKYKTPTLRNITLTSPYMHDGSLDTLEAVIDFYDSGGISNENLDPMIRPLGLSIKEKFYLLEFLKTFEGDNFDQLISDAFAQKIGDR